MEIVEMVKQLLLTKPASSRQGDHLSSKLSEIARKQSGRTRIQPAPTFVGKTVWNGAKFT